MSGTKCHENDFTLPSRLIAPLPGRLGSKTDKEAGIYPFTDPTLDAPFPCMAVYGGPDDSPPMLRPATAIARRCRICGQAVVATPTAASHDWVALRTIIEEGVCATHAWQMVVGFDLMAED